MNKAQETSTEIKPLAIHIRKNGFDYHLVQRNEKFCVYSQHNSANKIVGYELFKHKIIKYAEKMKKLAKMNGSTPPENMPEFAEAFPSDEEFGKRAWYYPKLEFALKAMNAPQ